MSVSAGEIEATLRLVDQWSGPLKQAVDNTKLSATTMGDSLASMTDRFSGRKLVEEAALMQRAIIDVGGLAKLTSQELLMAGQVTSEAAAKMRAMGLEVPPGFKQISAAADEVAANMKKVKDRGPEMREGIMPVLKEIAVGLAEMFALEKVVEFAKRTMESAHSLEILSQQTQIGLQDLQTLTNATKDYHIEGEELARALFQLGRRIAGGDESVATAFHMMGLSLEEVRGKSPMELFVTAERALGKLHGTVKDTAAADLFGGRLGNSMVALSAGFDDVYDHAQGMKRASDESIKALADMQREIERTQRTLNSYATETLGKAAGEFNTLHDTVDKGANKWALYAIAFAQFWTNQIPGIKHTELLASAIDAVNRAAEKHTTTTKKLTEEKKAEVQALSEEGQAWQFLIKTQQDALEPLKGYQKEILLALDDMGQLTAKNAAAIGVSASQFAKFKKGLEEDKKGAEEEAAAVEETTKLWDEYFTLRLNKGGTTTEKAIGDVWKWYENTVASAQKAKKDTKEFYDAMYAVAHEKLEGIKVDWAVVSKESKAGLADLYERARATYEALRAVGTPWETLEKYRLEMEKARDRMLGLKDAAENSISPLQAYNEKVMGMPLGLNAWNAALMAVNNSLDKNAQKADDAKKKMEEAARAAAELRRQGGSFTLDELSEGEFTKMGGAKELARIRELYKSMPGRKSGGSGLTGVNQGDAQGYLAMLEEQRVYAELLAYAKAHKLPGFAGGVRNFSGGRAVVGERGPEVVDLPPGSSVSTMGEGPMMDQKLFDELNSLQAQLYLANNRKVDSAQQAIIDMMARVAPPGYGFAGRGGGGGGPTFTNTFHVNGTAEEMASVLFDRLMTQLKSIRKWPSA